MVYFTVCIYGNFTVLCPEITDISGYNIIVQLALHYNNYILSQQNNSLFCSEIAKYSYYSRIIPVLASAVTLSPGPMMVYAVTLNLTTVLGLKPFNVYRVADVLV